MGRMRRERKSNREVNHRKKAKLPKNQITPAISVLPWQWEHDFVKVVSFSEGKMKGNKQGNFGKTKLNNFWYASQPASIPS
jgi:hypothetical protein